LRLLAVCDRFRCTPSQALAEPAWVLQLIEIERRVRPDDEQ
jgi:hypothetical protein